MGIFNSIRSNPLYGVWYQMIHRCYNLFNAKYHNYGGCGIKVCDEWKYDFMAFHNYVILLPNYNEQDKTIDRINTLGNYEPGNLRWADKHTQGANKRIQSNNTSGYTGIYKHKGKWRPYITINKNTIFMGGFDDIIEAVWTRNNFIIENELFEYPIQEICQQHTRL